MARSHGGDRSKPRLSPKVQEETRAKIDTTTIVNKLINHVKGDLKLEASQIRAAEILLKKTLPDLSATELSQDPDRPINPTISDKPMDKDEWKEKHSVGSTSGSAGSTGPLSIQ